MKIFLDIDRVIDGVKYRLRVIKYHLMYGRHYVWLQGIKIRYIIFVVERRLRGKGYLGEESLEILARFVGRMQYKQQAETTEVFRALNQSIVDISSNHGIPQWELREKIQQDFKIDI